MLSTRRDLPPPDIADELAAAVGTACHPSGRSGGHYTITRAFRKPLGMLFTHFEREPVASASIRVHFATLPTPAGASAVAVKVLRRACWVIERDLQLIRMMATWIGAQSADGKRLKPRRWWPSSTNTCTTSWT